MIIPNQWDIIWIQSEPHVGKEMGGHTQLSINKIKTMSAVELLKYYKEERRPELVVSNKMFNRFGIAECMPITTHNNMKGEFRHKVIKLKTLYHKVHGYIIPFQVLGYDYVKRHYEIADKLSLKTQEKVIWPLHDIF